jgi:putative phosphatase
VLKKLATGSSAFSTFFQSFPRLPMLLRKMRPTWHLSSLSAVTPEFLAGQGIKAMIWDVDGTLTRDRGPGIEPSQEPPFRALMAAPALKHVVLSNASEERFTQLGTLFPMLTILRAYLLGEQVLYRKRHGAADTWSPEELERQLAAGAAVIRKPSAALVDYAVRELGVTKSEVVMIGDQYLTDVAGANLGGVRSIKLPTFARETFRFSVRLSQRIELMLYALLYGRARITA